MTDPPTRSDGWADRFRSDLGRSVIQLVAGILAATLAYVALVVSTLSWCIPDSCERSPVGIVAGTVTFGVAAAGALRWLSLGRLRWSHAAFVGVAVALVLAGYEAVDQLVL